MKSKIISVSAVSAGLIAISLTIGAYVELADLFSLIVASVFLILPFYYKSYKGAVLAFLVGGVLAFLFSGFNVFSLVFPSYFLFFGLYPIFAEACRDKKVNKYVKTAIGIIWCVAFFYGAFFYYTTVMDMPLDDFPKMLEFLKDYILIVIGVLAFVFYFVYDRFIFVMRIVIDRYLGRIIK